MARTDGTDTSTRTPSLDWQGDGPQPDWWEDWVHLRDLITTSRVPEARVLSKELAAKWPESDTLQHYARVLEPPAVRRLPSANTGRDYRKDYAWIREHGREYPGCWLAVFEDRLIAADPDLKVVLAAAREDSTSVDRCFTFRERMEQPLNPPYLGRLQFDTLREEGEFRLIVSVPCRLEGWPSGIQAPPRHRQRMVRAPDACCGGARAEVNP